MSLINISYLIAHILRVGADVNTEDYHQLLDSDLERLRRETGNPNASLPIGKEIMSGTERTIYYHGNGNKENNH